nr:MAG TPA: hypothetical protein [Caudoviricetes sp.]DAV57168.1 MAG TPA: hypothetical protein [Caudoviricetes sp.]
MSDVLSIYNSNSVFAVSARAKICPPDANMNIRFTHSSISAASNVNSNMYSFPAILIFFISFSTFPFLPIFLMGKGQS